MEVLLIRFVASALAAFLLGMGIVAPLFGTYLPYWKQEGHPSGIMSFRMLTRLTLMLLFLASAVSGADNLGWLDLPRAPFRVGLAVVSLVFCASFGLMVFKHPEGWRGL